jgi:hypothetical protein
MSKLLKSIRSNNFEASIWENEKDLQEGGIIGFQTISLRKTWRDVNGTFREQKLHLRKQDVERVLVLLRKVQEHLLLEGENDNKKGDEH